MSFLITCLGVAPACCLTITTLPDPDCFVAGGNEEGGTSLTGTPCFKDNALDGDTESNLIIPDLLDIMYTPDDRFGT